MNQQKKKIRIKIIYYFIKLVSRNFHKYKISIFLQSKKLLTFIIKTISTLRIIINK